MGYKVYYIWSTTVYNVSRVGINIAILMQKLQNKKSEQKNASMMYRFNWTSKIIREISEIRNTLIAVAGMTEMGPIIEVKSSKYSTWDNRQHHLGEL